MSRPVATGTRTHPAWLLMVLAVVLVGVALGALAPAQAQLSTQPEQTTQPQQSPQAQETGQAPPRAPAQDPEDVAEDEDVLDAEDVAEGPVVLIGVGGLSWADVSEHTPALLSLTEESVASLIVRSVRSSTCPAEGWLAVSAGNRAGDTPGRCRVLTSPPDDGLVPGWSDYVASAQELSYRAQPGLLGEVLAQNEVAVAAIGPGAAIALAGRDGRAPEHAPRAAAGVPLTTQVLSAARDADLLVIDAGSLRPEPRNVRLNNTDESQPLVNPISPERFRVQQLALIDRRVASVLAALDRADVEPMILLAGIADDGATGLRVLSITGTGDEPGLGISASSRQDGYVMATDLFPTLVALLDLPTVTDSGVIGSPMRIIETDKDVDERREFLAEQDRRAQAVKPIVPTYYLILVALNLALFGGLAIGLKRPAAERLRAYLRRTFPTWSERLKSVTAHRRKVLRGMRVFALAVAALPVSSFLANMLPWWRNTPAALGLAVYIALIVAAIVLLALIGPWRRHVLGPATVVAGITALVLTVDIATGARLQVSAVMGISTLVAGRMYGMNNTAFTLFTVSCLMVAIAIANHLVINGRRRVAAVVTIILGLAAAVFDGAPGLGADFGGPPAILPAFGVLALMAAGIRLTWLRVFAVLAISAVATVLFAFVDWLRPAADHTHLGRFFQTVLDGGLWDVVVRNLGQNVSLLFGNTPLTLLALCGVLTVVFVLARPIRVVITEPGTPDSLTGGTPISQMGQEAPMLPPGIIAIGVALGIGMAVNDSGIAIPANGVALGVPLLVAACTTWMLDLAGRGVRSANTQVPTAEPDEQTATAPAEG